ncbi:hypothetical protein, partial [Salmonella enterica]|uniref:hypothetical protein n=1 Tax=Salmonella enterica TaxID=28901 RepID=UPI0039F6C716
RALAPLVGLGRRLIFKRMSLLRPEDVVLEAKDAEPPHQYRVAGQRCCPVLSQGNYGVNSARVYVILG